MKRFFYYLYLFIAGGFAYCTLEIIWRGRTHYSMFFAGGIIFLLFILIAAKMQKAHLITKCLLGALIITAVELIFGMIFNIGYHMSVWDYSNMPMNLLGQICLPFSVLWFGLCFVLFKWVIKKDFYEGFI